MPELNDFNLETLIKFGEVEREVEPVAGLKITLRTLSEDEKTAAYAKVGAIPGEANILVRMQILKIPLLALAIKTIGGKEIATDESRDKLIEVLKKSQSYLIDAIYNEYERLVSDQVDIVKSGLKKNN